MAKHFYSLLVTDIERNTRDSVVISLRPNKDDSDAFQFIQGQYLTFRQEFEGEELRRSYSICSGINDNTLRVGIKKVDGGWFSTWANTELKVGDTLEAMVPNGRFFAPLERGSERHYIGFAGGSGITPIISIVKTVLEEEPLSHFTLVYGNRSTSSIMFREELAELKSQYLERLSIVHILESDAADIDLFHGRIDREKCDALFGQWIDLRHMDLAFICGPEPMMLAIVDALKAHGLAEDQIKYELFKSSLPKKARAKTDAKDDSGNKCKVTIIMDGVQREVNMAKDGETVLEAALNASIDAPYSCCAGVCSTCVARVIEGKAEMETNSALEDYEVERGLILTCQARPITDKLVVQYDV